jgi:hypothetical protein
MPPKANPYATSGKPAGQKKGGGGGGRDGGGRGDGGGGEAGKDVVLAVYPVENTKKESILDGIKESITKRNKDPSAIEWSGDIRDRTGFLIVPRPLASFVLNLNGNEIGGARLLIGSAGPPPIQEKLKRFFDDHRSEIICPPATVDLSDLQQRLEGVRGPEPWKYLLFLAARAAREQQMSISILKFENNNLDKHAFFFGINKFFPELSQVSLRGNEKLRQVLGEFAGDKNPFGATITFSWDGQIDAPHGPAAYVGWNSRIEFAPLSPSRRSRSGRNDEAVRFRARCSAAR